MAIIPWFSSVFLLVTSFMIIIPEIKSDFFAPYCSNATTYAANSNFPNNLDTLLRSLSSNATTNPTGFYAAAVAGNGSDDTVYGLFLCRGDQNTTRCGSCVSTAVRERTQRINCPRSTVGILWYDECMLRYSSQTLVGLLDQTPTIAGQNEQNISGNQTVLANLVGTTMNELVVQASNDETTGRKYATREVSFTATQSLYALVQCTPDLTTSACDRCLRTEIGQLNTEARGMRVLQPSCNIRYEIYPFLDGPSIHHHHHHLHQLILQLARVQGGMLMGQAAHQPG